MQQAIRFDLTKAGVIRVWSLTNASFTMISISISAVMAHNQLATDSSAAHTQRYNSCLLLSWGPRPLCRQGVRDLAPRNNTIAGAVTIWLTAHKPQSWRTTTLRRAARSRPMGPRQTAVEGRSTELGDGRQ